MRDIDALNFNILVNKKFNHFFYDSQKVLIRKLYLKPFLAHDTHYNIAGNDIK